MRSHAPRQRRPADQAKDQRDEKEPHLGRPFLRNESGDGHEKRDRRHRSHGIGHHLQDRVDPPPIIAGYAPDDQRQHKSDEHTDTANLKRGPDSVKCPREDILAAGIGAKQVDTPIRNAEQMGFCRDEAKKLVFRARNEKLHVTALILIDCLDPAEIGLDRPLALDGMEEGPDRTAIFVAEHRHIGCAVQIILVTTGHCWVVGRQERRQYP